MTDAPSAPLPPVNPPAAPKPNVFRRIVGVLSAPTQTFQEIAARPDVLAPLLILLVVSILSGVAIAQKADFNAMAHEAMESNPQTAQFSAEQSARMVRFTSATMRIAAYAGPALVLVILLIVAGINLIAFRLMAGEGNFVQALSATTYAWYPRLIKGVLGTIVLLSKKSISIYDLQNPLRSNPAFLFNPKLQPVQYALAGAVDLFSIWCLVLMVIGFAALSKLPRSRAWAITIVLWVLGVVVTLIGPAFQAIRMHS